MPLRFDNSASKRILLAEDEHLPDVNERFAIMQASVFFNRHLRRYPVVDKPALTLVFWILGEQQAEVVSYILAQQTQAVRKMFADELEPNAADHEEYADALWPLLKKARPSFKKQLLKRIQDALEQRRLNMRYQGLCDLENNQAALQTMFGLNISETEFCMFLYLLSSYEPLESYFVDHLKCQQLSGRRFLHNVLNLSKGELNAILSGKLAAIGMFEMDTLSLGLESTFRPLFENADNEVVTRRFFTRLPSSLIPLKHHFVSPAVIDHCLNLLHTDPVSATHILFYGPPGTGKTSFAEGLAAKLRLPAFSIARDSDNTTRSRRAAIVAALNMTCSGRGSLIVVDEADNLLNTQQAWFMRGETQDKGWLNGFMDLPGVRMIWITNHIDAIEPSVLRRFAFSLAFKPFSRRQRIRLWETIRCGHKVKKLLKPADMVQLAERYPVSAGTVDMAIRKAKERGIITALAFVEAVGLTLEAHTSLMNDGRPMPPAALPDRDFSTAGLNIEGHLPDVLEQVTCFDQALLNSPSEERLNLNLLFYGPSGSGKSELARHIGITLKRDILCRRGSDVLNMYVGETEKNMRRIFEEAETQEAILVLDEIDTFLFSRAQARHSWEVSFTNEFLVCLEHFRGILIGTTNRLSDLDAAAIRRFNHKLGFGCLDAAGKLIFYHKLLAGLDATPLNDTDADQLTRLTDLTPGDFKVVRERFRFLPKPRRLHPLMITSLADEARTKARHAGQRMIGF